MTPAKLAGKVGRYPRLTSSIDEPRREPFLEDGPHVDDLEPAISGECERCCIQWAGVEPPARCPNCGRPVARPREDLA